MTDDIRVSFCLAELSDDLRLVRGKGTRGPKCATIDLAKRMRRPDHWEKCAVVRIAIEPTDSNLFTEVICEILD
jgi:hypothetical protein